MGNCNACYCDPKQEYASVNSFEVIPVFSDSIECSNQRLNEGISKGWITRETLAIYKWFILLTQLRGR